ncbi:MAG: CDP-alcohol phosphatidyltransferase family protein [Elusimicrobia bacterium]|nr:CDP-alcohol phosphatidyltransferase family protein [Elusimicrobiota bacterium]
MRAALLIAVLCSSLPASAVSFSEGRPGGEPVIRVAPGAKELLPIVIDPLKLGVPAPDGVTIPQLGAAIPEVGLLKIADFAALAAELQPPGPAAAAPEAEKNGVLPGLEVVGAKLEQSASEPAHDPWPNHVLDYAFDKWADGGGAPRTSVEGSAPSHERPSPSASSLPERTAPAAPPPPVKETPRWYNIFPNLVTTANLWSGLAGAYLASQGKIVPTVAAVIAANVFDALDGRTARALKVKNPLGIDYDSLADIVSFGVAPALLIFKAALLPALGVWGFPIAALFATAGWFRLSRFNVGAHAEEDGRTPHKKSDSFTGLPIPGGAGVILATALILASLPALWAAPVAVAATLLAAGAMASRLPYPAFKKGGVKALLLPAAVGLAAVIPLAALGLYSFIPAAVFGLYLTAGPLIWLARRRRGA